MDLKVDPKKIKVGDMVRTGGVALYEITTIEKIPCHDVEGTVLTAVTLECREKGLKNTIRSSPWVLQYATYDPDWYIEKLWKEDSSNENL